MFEIALMTRESVVMLATLMGVNSVSRYNCDHRICVVRSQGKPSRTAVAVRLEVLIGLHLAITCQAQDLNRLSNRMINNNGSVELFIASWAIQ